MAERPQQIRLAITLYISCIALYVLLGLWLFTTYGVRGLVALQFAALGLPVAIMTHKLPYSASEVLGIFRPTFRTVVAAILLGGCSWLLLAFIVLPIQEYFVPIPEAFLHEREALLETGGSGREIFILWICIALTPAVFEEGLFRGLLFFLWSGQQQERQAIVSTAVLFALFHFNPYQLIVTFILGCLLGYIRWKTGSIFCSMIFHLCNNSMVLVMAQYDEYSPSVPEVLGILFLIFVGGYLLIRPMPEESMLESSRHDPK